MSFDLITAENFNEEETMSNRWEKFRNLPDFNNMSDERIVETKQNMIDEMEQIKAARELYQREQSVFDGYMVNFLPYDKGELQKHPDNMVNSFDDLDDQIVIKACQNDIRMLLQKYGVGFSGQLTIQFAHGKPQKMITNIEYHDEGNRDNVYEDLKDYVGGFGFTTYKKNLKSYSRVIAQKTFRYSNAERMTSDELFDKAIKNYLKTKKKK